jgi:hypothetical protein
MTEKATLFMSNRPWSEDEDQLLVKHYLESGPDILSGILGRTPRAVGIRASRVGAAKKHYKLNHDFFSKPTPVNSYVAGYVASDGCIGTEKSPHIRWGIKEEDIEQLYKIKNLVGYTGPVLRSKTRPEVYMSLYSSKMVSDLEGIFNIWPRKSLDLNAPVGLDYINSLAYIIGYIDGDGSIMIRKSGRPAFSVVGTRQVLIWIRSIFNLISAPIRGEGTVAKFKHSGACYYALSGRRVVDIISFLYSIEVPKLKRKWGDKIDYIAGWRPKR